MKEHYQDIDKVPNQQPKQRNKETMDERTNFVLQPHRINVYYVTIHNHDFKIVFENGKFSYCKKIFLDEEDSLTQWRALACAGKIIQETQDCYDRGIEKEAIEDVVQSILDDEMENSKNRVVEHIKNTKEVASV